MKSNSKKCVTFHITTSRLCIYSVKIILIVERLRLVYCSLAIRRARGIAVIQALCYKPEGRWFQTR
jgi:hypothetical protein